MRKFWSFFRHYWFGLLISSILMVSFLLFLLVLVSPRQDVQKRGFIPCTEALAQNLLSCSQENKYSCGIKHILANSWCDIKVIGRGWKDWWQGKQASPWSNYIYEPQHSDSVEENDEFYAEYKAKGISPELDMQNLIKMSQELDEKIAREEKEKQDEKTK